MIFYHEINLLYNRILDRDVDTEGYNCYKNFLENGGSISELESLIKMSDEFKLRKRKKKKIPKQPEIKNVIELVEPVVKEHKDTVSIEVQTESTVYDFQEKPAEKKSTQLRTVQRVLNPLSENKKKVNVFACFRNNADCIAKITENFEKLEQMYPEILFCYYFFENDSVDETPYLILDFMRKRQGNYTLTNVATKKWADVKALGRVKDMAMYRNAMKDLCSDFKNSKYSIIVDTGVDYTTHTYNAMVKVLDENPDVAMVTPYGVVKGSDLYYDTYAFESMGKTKKIDIKYDLFNVKSAFAGFVVIRTEVLEKCHWDVIDEHHSEHNYFCEMVRNYGKVVVATKVKVQWTK